MYRHPYRNRAFRRSGTVPLAGPGSWEPGTREQMNAAAALACSRSNSAIATGLDLIDGYYDGTGFEEYAYAAKRWPGKWPLIAGHYPPDVFWRRIEGWSVPTDKWPAHVREHDKWTLIGLVELVSEFVERWFSPDRTAAREAA
jgi:hypothetical protein